MLASIRVIAMVQNRILRKGIGVVIEAQSDMHFAGSAEDLDVVLRLFEASRADLVLIDLDVPADKGLDAIRRIRNLQCNAWIIGLATHDGDDDCDLAIKAGAVTVIPKDLIGRMLVPLIRAGRPDHAESYERPKVIELTPPEL
jgi:DNA-binding NarL/FixJ family response regulator